MGTITTLRPSATFSGTGWSAVPSGTLHGVTSDDNDTTYALWSGTGSAMILDTPAGSPPAGERRHAVRLRARGEDGNAHWSVLLGFGTLTGGASGQFPASPTTIVGSWGFGAPPDGSTMLSAYVSGESIGVKINELYLDVDTREAPTFTPQILDGSGTPTTTISDTTQPTILASSIDLDGLNARQYRYWVTSGATIVWDTGIVSGASANQMTSPLGNGAYTAHLQIWTTLGQDTAYASNEETLAFTMSVGSVEAPDNPGVDPLDGTPFYTLTACAPDVSALDGGVGWIEIQRVDCPTATALDLPGVAGSYVSSPDAAALDITGDIDIRAQVAPDDWTPAMDSAIVSKSNTSGNQRSYQLVLLSGGALRLTWSTDGTGAGATNADSTVPTGFTDGSLHWVRVTLAVATGTVTFYTSSDGATWTQLGTALVFGTTGIFAGTATANIGARSAGAADPFSGLIYRAEIRSGINGPLVAEPRFDRMAAGATGSTDSTGKLWTLNGTAAIVAVGPDTTRTVSIAMLGPLTTGECAEWVDYTLPRTGSSPVCDHEPDPCCSYYRARTVGRIDGALRISGWSDIFNPAIPAGLIVMWPSTAASLPSGWQRTTALDDRYAKGIATSATEPGITGGGVFHGHTTPGHTHGVDHSHTHTGNTGAATGSVNSTPNSAGTARALTTHTHSRPTTGTATLSSAPTSPGTTSVNNDPARLDVIYMESDGSPLGVPASALGVMPDISVSGWTDYANATGRFLKGAAAAGDGGATAASTLDSHTHTAASHLHTVGAHVHTSAATGAFNSANTLTATGQNALNATSHTHPITINSGQPAALASASGGVSGTGGADMRPPFRNVRVKQNTSGVPSLPVGLICAWRGSLASIPDNWSLCDGTGGRLDLTGVYPQGATSSIGTAGGSSATHTHTGPSHTHTTSGHSHTETIGSAGAAQSAVSTTNTVSVVTATHTHSATDTDSTSPTVVSASTGTLDATTTEPLHEEVAFVQLTALTVPGTDPERFCLEWDDDEHLIRTQGPSGPMWANVHGQFSWDVDRPFTSANGVMGSRFVTSAPPGARNLRMSAAVESEDELGTLHAVLARPLVLISPSDAEEVWAAPVAESVRVIRVGRIRQVTADFIGTGPQPPPQLADVG